MTTPRQFAPRQNQLRARGNLTYLQFIKLVKNMWAEAHPGIPIIPTGGDNVASYPAIMYGLELRKTHASDPKRRFRETVFDTEKNPYIVNGQRFDNIVSFTSITEKDPVLAEEIIEAFEDFMQEMTPIFKELGVSELIYSRRYADNEQTRPGEGVAIRKVAYLVTLEKVVATRREKLEQILISARQYTSEDESDAWTIEDPRYYTPIAYWGQSQEDLGAETPLITVPKSFFRTGDRVYISPVPWDKYNDPDMVLLNGYAYPPDLTPGFYYIRNVVGSPYANDIKYELADSQGNPITEYGPIGPTDHNGIVYYGRMLYEDTKNITAEIFDSYSHATPWS